MQACVCTRSTLAQRKRVAHACACSALHALLLLPPPPPQSSFPVSLVHTLVHACVCTRTHLCDARGLHTRVHTQHCTLCFSSTLLPPNSFMISMVHILVQALPVHHQLTRVMHEGCTHVCTQCIARFAPPPLNSFTISLEHILVQARACTRTQLCDARGLHTRVHKQRCTLCFSSPLPPGIPVQFPWCTSLCKPVCASAVHSFDAHLEDARGLHTRVHTQHCTLCSSFLPLPPPQFLCSFHGAHPRASLSVHQEHVCVMHKGCTCVCVQCIACFAPLPSIPLPSPWCTSSCKPLCAPGAHLCDA